jgi:hypothetical protein
VDEEGAAGRQLTARRRVNHLRVAGGYHHAPVSIKRIGEVVTQPTILAGDDAGRPALADAADMDHAVGV